MIDVDARIDSEQVQRALGRMARFGRDLSPVLREVRRPFVRDQVEHRQQQEGPDGKWPARSPFTIARAKARSRAGGRKRGARGRTLGKLPLAFKVEVSRRRLAIVSRVRWSGVHQEGAGRVGRAPRIPQRQFFWLSRKLMTEVADVIIAHAQKAFHP